MKAIKKVAETPLDEKTGLIFNGTNIEDKTTNTYSAEIIDGLIGITKVTDISELFTVGTGFTIASHTVWKDRNRYFGNIVVKKDSGNFAVGVSNAVLTFNKQNKKITNTGCFLGTNEWQVGAVGYCYIGYPKVEIYDYNTSNYNHAKFDFDIVTA